MSGFPTGCCTPGPRRPSARINDSPMLHRRGSKGLPSGTGSGSTPCRVAVALLCSLTCHDAAKGGQHITSMPCLPGTFPSPLSSLASTPMRRNHAYHISSRPAGFPYSPEACEHTTRIYVYRNSLLSFTVSQAVSRGRDRHEHNTPEGTEYTLRAWPDRLAVLRVRPAGCLGRQPLRVCDSVACLDPRDFFGQWPPLRGC